MDAEAPYFLQIGQTNRRLCEVYFNQVPLIPYLQVWDTE